MSDEIKGLFDSLNLYQEFLPVAKEKDNQLYHQYGREIKNLKHTLESVGVIVTLNPATNQYETLD